MPFYGIITGKQGGQKMKITVLSVGKIKEKYFTDGIREYEKRLSRYCKLELIEVADEKTPEGASENEELKIKEKEGERLKKYIREDAYVVALAIEGKQLNSVEFSEKIEKLGVQGVSHIIFLIGGSLGLDGSLLKAADLKLSFSKMTFPHQMMRLILLEQLYRSYRIMKGEPYHK
jgi:23S rRNA (pseudouridine1915-N3)-methyltransferase